MRRLVTLTTDFGTRDAYVAQMKGVLYAQGPSELEVVDLTHDIGAQQVIEAALFVKAAWPRFPKGTIHMVIVDPGVGSERRALACEQAGQYFVGPDNGVMSLLFDRALRVVSLQPERFVSADASEISPTFHGRDVFAPAAARLAQGAKLSELGEAASELVQIEWPALTVSRSELRGEVLHVDRFGNLISNISRAALAQWLAPNEWSRLRVRIAASTESALARSAHFDGLPILRTYADAGLGKAAALIGSSEVLEIAVSNGSAATSLGVAVGAAIVIDYATNATTAGEPAA
jgi:S-adenosylmethionine hydrolase